LPPAPILDIKVKILVRAGVLFLAVIIPGQGNGYGVLIQQVAKPQGSLVFSVAKSKKAVLANVDWTVINMAAMVAGGVDPEDAGGNGLGGHAIDRSPAIA